MTGSTLAALCGVGMLTYAVQSSAQAPLAAAPESSRPVLPENPNLTTLFNFPISIYITLWPLTKLKYSPNLYNPLAT